VRWEECYALPGTNLYIRLAWERHPVPPGSCPIKPPQLDSNGNPVSVEHFNITTAVQGFLLNNFNYGTPSNQRQIIDDEHIAVWKDGVTGKTCVSWYADGRLGPACRWSTCGAPPWAIFSPWTVGESRIHFRTALAALGKLLASFAPDPLIVDGLLLLLGAIVIVGLVYAAILALGLAAGFAAAPLLAL
jgi:hypothetical protein